MISITVTLNNIAMKLFDSLYRRFTASRKFGSDTDQTMKSGLADVVVRRILSLIGPGDLAEDCDEVTIYCQNPMYDSTWPKVRLELLRQLCDSGNSHQKLVQGIKKGGFKVVHADAPGGATPVEGLEGKVAFEVGRRMAAPMSLVLCDDGGKELFRLDPPLDEEDSPRLLIGRNVPGGRQNDIDINDQHVSRSQAKIYWKDDGWIIQDECGHTYVDMEYIRALSENPIRKKAGTIYMSTPASGSPRILFRMAVKSDR